MKNTIPLSSKSSAFLGRVSWLIYSVLLIMTLLLVIPERAHADDSCTTASNTGTDVSIPLNDNQFPASDLFCDASCIAQIQDPSGVPHILTPEEAWLAKQRHGLDLSTLDPDTSTDIWKASPTGPDSAADLAIPFNDGDQINYQSDICSSSTIYRFNMAATAGGQTYTLMLSRNLHTYFLRREILRKLGYVIPAMKYVKTLKVKFPDLKTRDSVLQRWLPSAANGASARWCSVSASVLAADLAANKDQTIPCNSVPDAVLGGNPLNVQFQDIMVMDATPLYYNSAIGAPVSQVPNQPHSYEPEQQRILRALAVIYDLVDLPESVNQFDWFAGHSQNNAVTFHVDDLANFAITADDAMWILRRIARLSRADFTQIVANSSFPSPVGEVIVEKLIARRNSLMTLFSGLGLKQPDITFDSNVNDGSVVVNGKVIQEDWPGYASRFASGDPQNPLKGLWWYILSAVDGNALDALVTYANGKIPSLSQTAAESTHQAALQQGLMQAFENGQSTKVNFGAWSAPIASGSVQISRDVVLGQYLGTNNLVQLADTFGFTGNIGLMIGFDGTPAFLGLQGLVQATASISLTHLKPLTSLKQGVTEPVDEIFVPWLLGKASSVLNATSTATQDSADQIAKQVEQLQTYLGVGESFILTESINGTEQLSAGLNPLATTMASSLSTNTTATQIAPTVAASLALNELVLSRIQIYRKDLTTIQVFKDNGALIGPTLSFEFTVGQLATFPVVNMSAKGVTGTGHSEIYSVNIDSNLKNNPGLYANAAALTKVFRTGSVSSLTDELHLRPIQIDIGFTDETSSFQFFHYNYRGLSTNSNITVTLGDGYQGKYIEMSDGQQTGHSYQELATNAATFLLQFLMKNSTYSIDTHTNSNPGQTFYGDSQTRNVIFEGAVGAPTQSGGAEVLSQPYVRVSYRWEGWDMESADIVTLTDSLSAKYGFTLYPKGFLGDTTDIKMYELQLGINLYQSGIDRITSMTPDAEAALITKYQLIYDCGDSSDYKPFSRDTTSLKVHPHFNRQACMSVWGFRKALDDYQYGRNDRSSPESQGSRIMSMINDLEGFMAFQDIVQLAGGSNHVYVSASLSGFKTNSEDSSAQPIASNTFGQSDNNNPNGPVDSAQNILGVQSGEFNMSWMRDVL